MSYEKHILELYSLPLAEFTAARNALAKEVRSGGERKTAEEIKRLAKASVTAWVVNQLYNDHRSTFEEFLAAGGDQRDALQADSAELRAATERKRALQADLLKSASVLLGGTALSPAVRQRISRSLDTLAAWPPDTEPPPLGRLTADLEPAGFDALLGARVARPVGPTRGKKRARRPSAAALKRKKQAEEALDEARRELARVRKAETTAKRALTRAEVRVKRALDKAKAAEIAAEKARDAADAAQLALRKARAARERAAQVTERQEAKSETAARDLDKLA